MGRNRKNLSPAQELAMGNIREVARTYRTQRAESEIEVRKLVKERNAAAELDLAIAVRRARDLDIPIARIGADGMGTVDRGTVHRWLKKTERMNILPSVEGVPAGAFRWADKETGAVAVKYTMFPTTIIDDSYPETLEGVAIPDVMSETGWAVTLDPGTVETEMGALKGWFSVEIEDVPTSTSNSLTSQLDQWVEANK